MVLGARILPPGEVFVSKQNRREMPLDQLKAEILGLASRTDGAFLRLAQCLRMAHDRDRGFYVQVCGQAKLGSRKAYYLVELAEHLGSLRLPEKRFEAIGWSKAHVIASATDRNVFGKFEPVIMEIDLGKSSNGWHADSYSIISSFQRQRDATTMPPYW